MAEQPNWLDDALARAKASAGTSLAPPSLAPSSLAPTMSEVGDDAPLGVPRSRSMPLLLASTGAGLLVAAACVFAVRMGHPAVPPSPPPAAAVAVAHVETPAIPAPPPATEPSTAQAGAAQVTATADQAPAHTVDTDSAPTGHHGRHGKARVLEARTHVAASPVAKEKEEAPAPAPVAAKQAAPPPPPHVGSALDAALRAAVGPGAAAPVAAAADPAPAAAAPKAVPPPPAADGRPERPSGSAVTATLNEVLIKARRCVEGMNDASRALVTFGPDGAAHKINVTGPAANDPKALQCLRTAFGRAQVPPFSSASYSAGVTIRPQ
jgi:hypothetical protein